MATNLPARNPEQYEAFKAKQKALEDKYAAKGIDITPDWEEEPRIRSVVLDFTSDEWVGLLNTEGEYLGTCCANISRVRDILFDTIRNGFSINVEDLHEAVQLMRHHDGCGDNPDSEDGQSRHPLQRMDDLWEAVKDEAHCRTKETHYDPNDLKDAINTIYHSASILAWDFAAQSEKEKFDSAVTKRKCYHRLVPAIRTLYKRLEELNLVPVPGIGVFCLVKEDGVEKREIVEMRSGGYAICRTEKEAQDMADYLNKFNDSKDSDRVQVLNYYTQPCRVSVENGLQVYDKNGKSE